jgi:MinD-like ATPase involved in chromosome partitioning or flagellar assembly
VEGAEAGWDRPEPSPRWRSLLDQALLGRLTNERPTIEGDVSEPLDHAERRVGEQRPPTPAEAAALRRRNRPPDPRPLDRQTERPLDPRPLERRAGYLPEHRIPEQRLPPRVPEQRLPEARLPQSWLSEPLQLEAGPHSAGSFSADALAEHARGVTAYPARLDWQPAQQPDGTERLLAALRRGFGKPRVIAFANPKGGVHKTTATVLCAATIGSARGHGVLAWDDNELRGTLGLRAGSARHARTIRHMIADLPMIEAAAGPELIERLDEYLRHASDGSYDVLAGEEHPRFAQRLDPHTVRRVLEVLCRTHDVICIDTGNNVESPNWQTVLQAADQLVVTSVPREDAAFTADWMLDLLHDMGMGELVEQAVTVLSCPTPKPSPLLEDLRRHFAGRTRSVAVVPYDPSLESGSSIGYAALQPGTRRAWLEAAAVIVERFSD